MANRKCYYTNDSFAEDDRHLGTVYILACIIENEPGYLVAGKYHDLKRAEEAMRIRNAAAGVSDNDVLDIVASSMRVSNIR